MPISFSQKHKEATKPSNKEKKILPHWMMKVQNYSNPQPGQFLVSLLEMIQPKTRRVLLVEKILEHFSSSHKWACMKRVVA